MLPLTQLFARTRNDLYHPTNISLPQHLVCTRNSPSPSKRVCLCRYIQCEWHGHTNTTTYSSVKFQVHFETWCIRFATRHWGIDWHRWQPYGFILVALLATRTSWLPSVRKTKRWSASTNISVCPFVSFQSELTYWFQASPVLNDFCASHSAVARRTVSWSRCLRNMWL